MSEEVTVPEDPYADRTPEQWREAAEKWYGIATDMKQVQDELTEDLAGVLMMARNYQKGYVMMDMPDPNLVKLRDYLIKYKMPAPYPPQQDSAFRIYADGTDITRDPDSIPGVETAELVLDNGTLRLIPKSTGAPIEVATFSTEEDSTEPIDEATRQWLMEDADKEIAEAVALLEDEGLLEHIDAEEIEPPLRQLQKWLEDEVVYDGEKWKPDD